MNLHRKLLTPAIELTRPDTRDGMALNRLVADCPPLDRNSLYCNLLQVSHFAETCVVAKTVEGKLVGSVTGYLMPDRKDTVFVWQVAVHRDGRGQGLAGAMLRELVSRPACRDVCYLETTIEPDNQASWALFKRFADEVGAEFETTVAFDRDAHFHGQHNTEMLMRIGPFSKVV